MKAIFRSICCVFILLFGFYQAQSQAKLSFQGVLKKANGVAVEDGTYSMTFKLYTTETGGSPIWMETQPAVDVASGIYSVILGNVNPITASFNQTYYLGVQVGSTELTPRFRLTSAPYALSLIGDSNKFPSSGTVEADSVVVAGRLSVGHASLPSTNTHSVNVNGGVLAKGGAPGLNGVSNAGYAFNGNSGDKDSGLFSIADGQVSLYVNNAEILKANSAGVQITGDINLSNGGTIVHNGQRDWVLVDTDDFSTGLDGWVTYNAGTPFGTGGSAGTSPAALRNDTDVNPTLGYIIRTNGQARMLKKMYSFNNITHSEVKIEFTLITMGVWENEAVVGGLVPADNVWHINFKTLWDDNNCFCGPIATGLDWGEVGTGQMVVQHSGNEIWAVFGSGLNEVQSDEDWAIANIKVYIR